ncbi:MAG: SAM-dependent methyltransferase, partial [Thermoleophilaceae bacterium]
TVHPQATVHPRAAVHFVGGGPGAPDLLTLRAAEAIAAADVVIWGRDLLMEELVTRHARPGAEIVPWPPATMADIHAVYDRAAADGLRVARLYAGDATIFARIHEELGDVADRGLPVEIVPGVSAVGAAAAALAWDLTGAREEARALVLTTREGRVPDPAATTAVFMAGREPGELQQRLLVAGYAPDTACAIAHRVSWPDEALVACPLSELAERLEEQPRGMHTLVLVGSGDRRRRAA